jgi:hypothetical protein
VCGILPGIYAYGCHKYKTPFFSENGALYKFHCIQRLFFNGINGIYPYLVFSLESIDILKSSINKLLGTLNCLSTPENYIKYPGW